eukprot:CAMPEP_0116059204 /NCGR_PEP_ID=MMETSP0322-20121206/5655_1 /TAXON_ID=163516 /ORGANISM="Leptocylindrus danicus var. apora, Strain B651" /LENGTH=328 /DNA_ID=CAMNT_0003543537 /DNA_START=364 /DNA_END=1350 /DNA_ORIENTATION=+
MAVPRKVAVAGATGRTGSLVVKGLLERGVDVVALVRDVEKANEKLPIDDEKLFVLKCDLGNEDEITACLDGCDSAVWAASGFTDNRENSWIVQLKKVLGFAFTPSKTIDAVGVPAMAKFFNGEDSELAKIVMLSSAGVTRPSWDESKKERLVGCADIPIVRLNPFNILNIKAECEENLRKSGTKYCIFRPCGLNDSHPKGLRPILSQGDVAVGRINRSDAARVLVECLFVPEAEGKTFESFTLEGLYPGESILSPLARMPRDNDQGISEEIATANYAMMQQLLPGTKQESASLAMGQTYEQFDKGETGRLGERGKEDAEGAFVTSNNN